MKNVAFLDLTPFFGGGQRFLITTQANLSSNNRYHFIVRDGATYKALSGENKILLKTGNWWRQLCLIRKSLHECQIDIIFLNGNRPIYFAPFLFGYTKVAYKHTSKNAFTRFKKTFGQLVLNFCYLFCDKIIVLYELAVEEIFWGKNKVRVINNGVAVPLTSKGTFRDDAFRIVCISRLDSDKGLKWLLEVFCDTFLNHSEVTLKIAGSGDMRSELEEYVRFRRAENIELLGFVEDTPALLAQCDLLILPSRYESFPLSILEAMASGLPVIATDTGGVSEMVETGKNGFLIRYNDSLALRVAIEKIYQNVDLRRRMGICSRNKFEQKFTIQRCVANIEKIYEERF